MIKLFFERDARYAKCFIHVVEMDENRQITQRGQPIVMVQVTDDDQNIMTPAAMAVGYEEIKSIMDELWNAGFRPSSTSSETDLLGAKDEHIKDLRKAQDAVIALIRRKP